ncbi:DUF397 domain-containing protein [Saccharothrix coeruleofusca]|uniref:DUF397 domain-containing protein n=1 Tax=Saccharothrix coeruleofusca TaxID=33919 RepID=A0A918ASU1_9PSEU|nr:DUF397 domain-containing protein [Saccharothrix coeruleofusca]MBP2335171.1 hypothetical protein [Saccharothrix coeruleofusca]GGP71335.1 hypothetical protein GCM10010185_50540 [Saccharothrix coeruleofusca]
MSHRNPIRTGWFKSSYSNPAQSCVEVRFDDGIVRVRDSKADGAGPVIAVSAASWKAFLRAR